MPALSISTSRSGSALVSPTASTPSSRRRATASRKRSPPLIFQSQPKCRSTTAPFRYPSLSRFLSRVRESQTGNASRSTALWKTWRRLDGAPRCRSASREVSDGQIIAATPSRRPNASFATLRAMFRGERPSTEWKCQMAWAEPRPAATFAVAMSYSVKCECRRVGVPSGPKKLAEPSLEVVLGRRVDGHAGVPQRVGPPRGYPGPGQDQVARPAPLTRLGKSRLEGPDERGPRLAVERRQLDQARPRPRCSLLSAGHSVGQPIRATRRRRRVR